MRRLHNERMVNTEGKVTLGRGKVQGSFFRGVHLEKKAVQPQGSRNPGSRAEREESSSANRSRQYGAL